MIEWFLRFLVFQYYKWFPKHYFKWRQIPGTKTYWVNVANGTWGEVEKKQVTNKKYKWFGKETTKTVAVYNIDCLLIYASNQENADRKAKARIEQFKNYTP